MTHCGNTNYKPSNISSSDWSDFDCKYQSNHFSSKSSGESSGQSTFNVCYSRSDYTETPGMGCPDTQLCCASFTQQYTETSTKLSYLEERDLRAKANPGAALAGNIVGVILGSFLWQLFWRFVFRKSGVINYGSWALVTTMLITVVISAFTISYGAYNIEGVIGHLLLAPIWYGIFSLFSMENDLIKETKQVNNNKLHHHPVKTPKIEYKIPELLEPTNVLSQPEFTEIDARIKTKLKESSVISKPVRKQNKIDKFLAWIDEPLK